LAGHKSSWYTACPLKNRNLRLLLLLTCLHLVGFCVYLAVGSQSEDLSTYDALVTTSVFGWSLMPLIALAESVHLNIQTDSAPIAIAFFIGNSVVWAGYVSGAYILVRKLFVTSAPQPAA
jgi:hypothetical protein